MTTPEPRNPFLPQAAAVLLAILASGVVALAASDGGLLRPAAEPTDGWVRGVRLVGAVAVVAGLVALGLQARNGARPQGGRGLDPLATGVGAAATLMTLLTLVALFAPPRIVDGPAAASGGAEPREGVGVAEGASGTPPPPAAPERAPVTEGYSMEDDQSLAPETPPPLSARQDDSTTPTAPPEGFDWDALRRLAEPVLLIVLVGMVAAGILSVLGRKPGPAQPVEPPVSLEDASSGLSLSRGEVLGGTGGPRRQITAAYERLLGALADAGAPRRPHEAPHEHLERALGPLGVAAAPMHRLAGLYVAAQFSDHPVTDEHRTAALEALDACLASLGPVPVHAGRPA